MFLDIAHSTGVAEAMGELRMHELITRFFFDIDEPISSHGGAVHAYVGDEAIVCWPVTADPARNGRCVLCFFAIERSMARLAADYRREFELLKPSRLGCTPVPLLSANAARDLLRDRPTFRFGRAKHRGARPARTSRSAYDPTCVNPFALAAREAER
jgi:hypothetical protein